MSRPRLPPGVMKESFLRFMPIWLRRSCSQITNSWIRDMSPLPTLFRANPAMELIWLALPRSTHWYQAETGYDLTHFSIDWEAETVSCPQGRISSSWTPVQEAGKSLIKVKFSQSDCKVCPARACCTGTTRRTLTLHSREQMQALFAARKREETDEWKRHLSPESRH